VIGLGVPGPITVRRFQTLPVQDRDPAAAGADQAGVLKSETGGVDARPANAKHLRKKLLRQWKVIAIQASHRVARSNEGL
jgi:hypothetical protein